MIFREILKVKFSDSMHSLMDIDQWRRDGATLRSDEPTIDLLRKLSRIKYNSVFAARLESVGLCENENIFTEWFIDYENSFMPTVMVTLWADPALFSLYILRFGAFSEEHFAQLYSELYEERKRLENNR